MDYFFNFRFNGRDFDKSKFSVRLAFLLQASGEEAGHIVAITLLIPLVKPETARTARPTHPDQLAPSA